MTEKTLTDYEMPILYTLLRTDLPDPDVGKSMAQVNHAGSAFGAKMQAMHDVLDGATPIGKVVAEWLAQAGTFGTAVILGVTRRQLHQRLEAISRMGEAPILSGLVTDPEYPIRDGDQTLSLPVDTCGYVFGRRRDCAVATIDLPRYKG